MAHENGVFCNAKRQHQRIVMPVLGNKPNALAQYIDGRDASQVYSIKDYAASFGGAKTYNRLSKFLLSVAFDTCDFENFTALDCQVQSPQRIYSAIARNVHIVEAEESVCRAAHCAGRDARRGRAQSCG